MFKKITRGLIIIFVLLSANSKAQTDANSAEALFIYNFLSHVLWPEGSVGEKYVIGVIGTTKTYDDLKSGTANRTVGNKQIEVIHYRAIDEISNCQVLLIAENASSKIAMINKKIAGKSCLVIGETAGLTNNGAVIDFTIIDGKLRYKVNQEAAKSKNLFVSAALIHMSI
jgi:hypothetical protein